MFGANAFGWAYPAQGPAYGIYGTVVDPKIVYSFASFDESVDALASFGGDLQAFASYDPDTEGFAEN